MLEQQHARIERQGSGKADAQLRGRIKLANALIPGVFGQADFCGQVRRLRHHCLGRRFDLERERHRQVLDHGHRLEQHGPLTDDAETIEGGEPVGAVGDLRRGPAERAHVSGIGQTGACNQVDEHFGGGLIEADQCHLIPRNQDKMLDAKRTKSAVLFRDGGEFENGLSHVRVRMRAESIIMGHHSMTDRSVAIPASPFVARWVTRLAAAGPSGRRALDIATGRGRHALAMAAAGYRVLAIDIQLASLRAAADEARTRGLSVSLVCADLTAITIPVARFSLVIVSRYLDRQAFPMLLGSLETGGVLVYETFTERQLQHERGPRSPDHLLRPGELRRFAVGMDVLFDEEVTEPDALARLVARRRD